MRIPSQKLLILAFTVSIPLVGLANDTPPAFSSETLPLDHISFPTAPPKQTVFLISDKSGWDEDANRFAVQLVENGNIVIGVDYPKYIAALNKVKGSCIYMVSDIEALSHQVQRSTDAKSYNPPIIAGIGAGGALALGMIAQSPQSTIAQAVVVDPAAGIALSKVLCTPAEKVTVGNMVDYGLTEGTLPAKVTISLTENASTDERSHAQNLIRTHPEIHLIDTTDPAPAALVTTLSQALDDMSGMHGELDLPIVELPAKPAFDTLAVVYSGDGGWRDIDQQVAGALQEDGMPVIGVDSLRYFWSKKSPQETADDLNLIIETYRQKWAVKNVLLVGYSFGSDVLPATYSLLPRDVQQRVKQLSLLALSGQVDYEISVSGWLGSAGEGQGGDTVHDLGKIEPKLVQCFYGKQETEDPCPKLQASGVEVIPRDGGHHFDGDYKAIAASIIKGLQRRIVGE